MAEPTALVGDTVSIAAADEDLFDAEFLGSLRRLFAKLQHRRPDRRRGLTQAPSLGSSREFKDRRAYVSGDDIRSIDWYLYARLERLFVRLYESVREYHVHILVDTSASMAAPYPEKRRAALRVALAFAWLALVNNHQVSLFRLDGQAERLLPPLKGQGHLHGIIAALRAMPFAGSGDPARVLRHFRPAGGAKGLLLVCSDLLGADPEQSVDALRRLAAMPHATQVVQLLHPEELAPDLPGSWQLVDSEGGQARQVLLGADELRRYRELVAGWLDRLATVASRGRVDYLRWATDASFEDQLLTLLERGRSLVGTR